MAAVDVGSNSLHMIIAQVDADGGITTLWRHKEMVGLGRSSFPAQRLSPHAMERAVLTLRRFADEAQRNACEKIVVVATSAVREATNGGDFIERVRRELGLSVRVVSAREEARLIYLGVRHAADLSGGPQFIFDLGGGSAEFIVADAEKAIVLASRKVGAARMTSRFIHSDPIAPGELQAVMGHYEAEIGQLCRRINRLKPVRAIGTSGTLENLAAMCAGGSSGSSNGSSGSDAPQTIEREAFEALMQRLLESRAEQREKMAGLDEQRRDQIVCGALLVNELFRRLQLPRIHLCRSALREGILVDYLRRHRPQLEIRRNVPDPRRRSVLDLGRRCHWHRPHSEHVARLCLALFDQLRTIHKLGQRERELIEFAALLHDIGWHIARKGHHKHAMYLILNGDLKGFSEEEIRIIAQIARYHRKSPPKASHEEFAALDPAARRLVKIGASLLRLADGLDRSHCGIISAVSCRQVKGRVQVTLKARGDAQLEVWAAQRKADLFVDIFDRSIEFQESK